MTLCPYCGVSSELGVLAHGGSVVCPSCHNRIRVLLMDPVAWDRLTAKLSIYNFLVRELESAKGDKLTICPVCGTPFFGEHICRNCRKCLTCGGDITESTEGVECKACERHWSWAEFIDRKQVLEGTNW